MNAIIAIKKPSLFRTVKSAGVFLYFVTMVLHNLFHSSIINYAWYFILLSCFVLGVVHAKYRFSLEIFAFAVLLLASVFANMAFVGNVSLLDIVYSAFYLGVFLLLSDEDLDERSLAIAIYVNCVILSCFLIRAGIGKAIFGELSNNYVSVLLLIPSSVYYIRKEHYHKTISVFPALAVFITCLLATGRGGILVSFLLLFFIVYYQMALRKDWMRTRKHAFFCFIVFCCAALVLAAIPYFLSESRFSGIFQRFSKYGMYGTGRIGIWKEYLSTMFKSVESIFFGVEFSKLLLMVRYKNNLHNSFLNLHAYYGLFFVLYVLFKLFTNAIRCIKEKKWIYFFIILVFLFRSLTDKIFGGGLVATPLLFFLLFYYHCSYEIITPNASGEKDNVKLE